ncbi:MAG: DUF58 domain-containing protein [Clostridiales Family XIII bacterium]|nr:DUF58 domain-containing protein [Clostridiales Family XIII bacterium]
MSMHSLKKIKNRILKVFLCVILLGICAIPAIFMNTIYGYLPGLMVVVAIACSFVYLQLQRRMLVYEELSDLSDCRRETDIEFSVELRNRFVLIFPKVEIYFYVSDLFDEDDTVTKSVITLAPKESRKFDFSVRFDHLGIYSAGLKKIVIHDLLGLFSYTIENENRFKVSVTPRIFDVEHLNISDTALTDSERMIVTTINDGADYTGVREYTWGDPIKLIHWKLSARAESYLTKQFESYGVVGITILMDSFSPEYDRENLMSIFDGIIETSLSIGHFAEKSGLEYEIIYTDRYGERRHLHKGTRTDFITMIDDIPKISTTDGLHTGAELLREEGGSRLSHGNIVYVTAYVSKEITDILLELKNRGKNPLLFVIVPDSLYGEERETFLRPLKLLQNAGIAWHALKTAAELGGGDLA